MWFRSCFCQAKTTGQGEGKDLSLDYMLAITASLRSGIPDPEQKFRTSEGEEDKHLGKLGYQLRSLITFCSRNLEISLEIQFS